MLLHWKLSFSSSFFAQKLNIILQFDDKRKTSLYKDFYYWASESSYMEWDAIFLRDFNGIDFRSDFTFEFLESF